jgi:hypothetical protein
MSETANQTDDGYQASEDELKQAVEATTRISDDDEARLDYELILVHKLNQTFSASLSMFEAALNGLVDLGKRMDQLTETSRRCREALAQKKKGDELRHDSK